MNTAALLTFFITTTLVGAISWYKTRKQKIDSTASFYFANRNFGFMMVGGALFFTNISAAQFIGENELTYTNNMSVMAWDISSVFAMLVVSEFIMPVYLRTGISTTPDFLGERYDGSTKRLVSVIFLISYLLNMLPSVLYSGAVAFNGLFDLSTLWGISYWQSIWILVWMLGLFGCVYSVLGGVRAIAISDVVLGVCMFAGGLLLPYYGLKYIGNGNVDEGLKLVLSTKTEHLNSIGSKNDAVPFSTLFTGMVLMNLYYWGTEQYIVQQALTSKNLAESQKGIALACVGKIISPLLLNIPGILAVQLYTSQQNATGIFPSFVRDVSPPVLTGFLASIIFGAALTTFVPGLNSASTLFVLNLYKPWKAKRREFLSEKELIAAGKKFELVACLLAMVTAPFILFYKKGLYNYLQVVGGSFSVPIFTIVFIGLITKRVPPLAAKAGLIFFIACYVFSQLVYDSGIHFLHILAILFVVTVSLMVIIGKICPMAEPYRPKLNNIVDVNPWGKRHIFSLLLLLLMIAMFVVFSPLVLSR